jgi:hypothetical protein
VLEVRLIGWLGMVEAGNVLARTTCASGLAGGALRSAGCHVITGEQGSSVKDLCLRARSCDEVRLSARGIL